MVGMLFTIVELCVHDNNQVSLDGQGPYEGSGCYYNLNLLFIYVAQISN